MKNNLKNINNLKNNLINKSWHKYNLSISNSAIQQIQILMKKNIHFIGLCIDIKKYGCAEFSFALNGIIKLNNNENLVYKQNGIKLFASQKAIPFIDGIQLDYIQENLSSKFKFNNYKYKYVCGCGNSFSI